MYSLLELNTMEQADFVKVTGHIFENSPWVMEKVWYQRPFSSTNLLLHTMKKVIYESSYEEQLALLLAYPDLGTKIELSGPSQIEQQGAALDQLSRLEFEQLIKWNNQYKEIYGYPFILAVRNATKEDVYRALHNRMKHSKSEEYAIALEEVFKIAAFRLGDIVREGIE